MIPKYGHTIITGSDNSDLQVGGHGAVPKESKPREPGIPFSMGQEWLLLPRTKEN